MNEKIWKKKMNCFLKKIVESLLNEIWKKSERKNELFKKMLSPYQTEKIWKKRKKELFKKIAKLLSNEIWKKHNYLFFQNDVNKNNYISII